MKFVSTRDQYVDGKPVKKGEKVEIEADRVKYLTARGYLVEEAEKKTSKPKSKAAE